MTLRLSAMISAMLLPALPLLFYFLVHGFISFNSFNTIRNILRCVYGRTHTLEPNLRPTARTRNDTQPIRPNVCLIEQERWGA